MTSMVERVTLAMNLDPTNPEHLDVARVAIEAVADEIEGLVEQRRSRQQNRGNDYIASCAAWLRRTALSEQISG